MAVVRKFIFDNDLVDWPQGTVGPARAKGAAAPAATNAPPPPPPPMFSEAEMQSARDAARRQGEETGQARGRSEAVTAFDKQVAATLGTIAQQTAAIAK